MADTSRCDEVRELLPELSAGVAAGDTRAGALAHLAGCPGCRRELEETSAVLDSLLLLAPEHEPSPGFESSVMAALTPDQRTGPRRGARAVLLAVAAAVIAVALAAGVAWWQSSDEPDVVVADVVYGGGNVAGQAVAHGGDRPWVYLDLDAAPSPGRYLVRLVTSDDRTLDVGWCHVRDGKGSWGWAVDAPPDDLRTVQLVRGDEVAMQGSFE
jgi:hypothetical protein